MKHCHEKFNRIQDPENKIPKEEPVFLLRAQDELASATLHYYIKKRRETYGDDDKIAQDLEQHLALMECWDKKKKAD